MKFGFDLDGVLCTNNITILRVLDGLSIEKRNMAEPWYYLEQKPLLDPQTILGEDDEFIVITGRSVDKKEITKIWLEKFCPKYKNLYVCDLGPAYGLTTTQVDNWSENQAKLKAKFINEEKLDVFLDDNGEVVKHLRKLCPNTKVIHYGGSLY